MTSQVIINVFTEDQMKAARDAILMWEAGPVNPCGVSNALNRAILAEFHATGQMDDSGPAVVLINFALQNIINRGHSFDLYSTDELINALDLCRSRVAGTKYEWKGGS